MRPNYTCMYISKFYEYTIEPCVIYCARPCILMYVAFKKDNVIIYTLSERHKLHKCNANYNRFLMIITPSVRV